MLKCNRVVTWDQFEFVLFFSVLTIPSELLINYRDVDQCPNDRSNKNNVCLEANRKTFIFVKLYLAVLSCVILAVKKFTKNLWSNLPSIPHTESGRLQVTLAEKSNNNNNNTHTYCTTLRCSLHSLMQQTRNPISEHISCLYSCLQPRYNTVTLVLSSYANPKLTHCWDTRMLFHFFRWGCVYSSNLKSLQDTLIFS